jgi:hypothetical protein
MLSEAGSSLFDRCDGACILSNSVGKAERITEENMSTGTKLITPKKGEHVRSTQHEGVFEVVFVNALMQTANIRLLDGTGHVVPNVPWTALKVLDKG